MSESTPSIPAFVTEALDSTSRMAVAVQEYARGLADTTAAGDAVLVKIANDCQAAHRELQQIASSISESDEADALRKGDVIYPALSRVMLLLSDAALAAADYDEAYGLQHRITAAMMETHRRATAAVNEAQKHLSRASATVLESATGALERTGAPELVDSTKAAVLDAQARIREVLDTAPEGSVVGHLRSGLELAHRELTETVDAGRSGWSVGAQQAAVAALARAREAFTTLTRAGKDAAVGFGSAGWQLAKLRAAASVDAAQARLALLHDRMAPAMTKARELGAEGVGRLAAACLVLQVAAEDVVVEASAAVDKEVHCSDYAKAAWEHMQLSSAKEAATSMLQSAAETEHAKQAVATVSAVDDAVCCGCATRTTSFVWNMALQALGYTEHVMGRIAATRATLEARGKADGTVNKPVPASSPPHKVAGSPAAPHRRRVVTPGDDDEE